MAILRALQAKHGDSLLLLADDVHVLIDGGPAGVYRRVLRDQLAALTPTSFGDPMPRLDLLMVSHIDADHIAGVIDLTASLVEAREGDEDPVVRIDQAWHNSFGDDLVPSEAVDDAAVEAASLLTTVPEALVGGHLSASVLASVGQGRRLRLDLEALDIDFNRGFSGGLVLGDALRRPDRPAWRKGAVSLAVIGPTTAQVEALRAIWKRALPAILAKERALPAGVAAGLDTSVSNLASLVVIADVGGREVLLTGDARGDMILRWLKIAKGERRHFHTIKLPHHGSDRNVNRAFFERLTADHYVVSGNGKHGNPEPTIFEMLFAARPALDYTVHLTYGPDDLARHGDYRHNIERLDAVLADPARRAVLRGPEPGTPFVEVPLV